MKVAANGINLNVSDVGSGEHALVFMHFLGGSSLEWSAVCESLSAEYRCVALDARGAGASDASDKGYRITELADDVQAVIEKLNLKSYVLVGHSMGGKTAQVLAARLPAGLKGLALVASSPASPMPLDDAQRAQMMEAYASRESIGWVIDNVLTSSKISEENRELVISDALRLSRVAYKGWVEGGTAEDYSKEVANVNVPVVIVAGDDDKVDPLVVVQTHVIPSFRNPETHILTGKGHLLPLEAPIEVTEILSKFATKVFA